MRARIGVALSLFAIFAASALSPARAAPLNDDFANSKTISSLPYADATSTVGASTELDEPDAGSSCAAAGASVWYRYTSPSDDRLDFSTEGSSFGAYIGVYTGDTLNSLTLVACARAPYLHVRAGTTYHIQVGDTDVDPSGGFVSVAGDLVLSIESRGLCADCPTYTNYAVPRAYGFRAGETSIGVNPKTNAAMFLLLTHTVRATWNDAQSPPAVTWKRVDGLTTSQTTADPILWTDRATGRTFVAQLVTTGVVGGSIIGYTDDDGANWTTTEPAQVAPAWDHQSIGGGPYPAPFGKNSVYENAIYYCAQLGASLCSRSDDGGLMWGPQTIMGPTVAS